jgi:hypothetical protein
MFCHIDSQATTTEIFSYMICQSCWKMYHWQSEHECGTCMMVLQHILAVLCEMFSISWPQHSSDFRHLDFYLWGHLKTLVYAAPVDNKEALHHRTVDACQTIRNYPSIFEQMRRSMLRCVQACSESHGGHFEHLL